MRSVRKARKFINSIITGIKEYLRDYRNFKVLTILFAVILAVAVFVIFRLVSAWLETSSAERGYRDLRQFAPDDYYAEQYHEGGPGQLIHGAGSDRHDSDEDDDEDDPEPPDGMILEPDPSLVNINDHYAGWIRIEDTRIDYPMVQSDNVRYLDTTFWGTHNRAGTIFLDIRNPHQFNGTFVIIYGHNSRAGGMFGSLHRYVTGDYMARHPDITIFTREGLVLTYRIFAAFATDIYEELYILFDADEDKVFDYFVRQGAPAGSTNFIALSTCVTSNSDDDRFIVLAAR